MNKTIIGMGVGALFALTWVTLGFWAFVLVVVAVVIGAIVGRIVDDKPDLRGVVAAFRGKRSSS